MKRLHSLWIPSFVGLALLGLSSAANAQTVQITSLGSRAGEFCELDRTLMFEDPTGVRILYDPAFTTAGGTDRRLGAVHVIILSHAHGDHIGDPRSTWDADSGSAPCGGLLGAARIGGPPFTPAPNTNLAEIAAAKNSAVLVARPMATFLAGKIQNIRGVPTPTCPEAAGVITVPRPSPCTANMDFGGRRTVTLSGGVAGVQIAIVPAHHDNTINPNLLIDPLRGQIVANGLLGPVGLATGYVLTFSNGLAVYLSGDTGITNEMETLVNRFYQAKLMVVNFDASGTKMGPEEAAFAVSQLIKPRAVIALHMGEVTTTAGRVDAGTRAAQFATLLRPGIATRGIPVYVPRSGETMEFDRDANCVRGCR